MSLKKKFTHARNGDRNAAAYIIEKMYPRLEKMATYYSRRCRHDKDDLLQEAYLGALDALKNVDIHIGDPEQYLLKHAKWRILDSIKYWNRRHFDTQDTELLDLVLTNNWDSIDTELWLNGFQEQLKPMQRTILEQLLLGYTWRETGAKTNCTSANVAYHVRQIQQTYLRWCEAS